MATTIHITHTGGGEFDAATPSGHTVHVDGDTRAAGPGPMELLLVALGTCSAVTIVEFLAKMRQPLQGLEVTVTGERREEAPRVYERIHVAYRLRGPVDRRRARHAVELVESRYCSVWTMLEATAAMSNSIEFDE
jgi:putative redox protein